MKKRWRAALFLICVFFVQITTNAYASSDTEEEATYALLQNNIVKVELSPEVDFQAFINTVGMDYSAFDGYKHALKYYYYKEKPGEYFIQSVMNSDEAVMRRDTQEKITSLKNAALSASGPMEQIEYVNNWLVDHITYDAQSFQDYLSGAEPSSLRPWSAAGALLDGRAVCEGYAGAFLLSCDALGIPCMKVNGTLQGTPHSWNSVYLASINDWLYVDVTNNDPGDEKVEPGYSTRLFLLTAIQFESYGYQWNKEKERALRDIRFPYLVVKQLDHLRSLGLVVGRPGGDFAYAEALTRNELAALLQRLHAGKTPSDQAEYAFPEVAEWARLSVQWCYDQGLMVGFPDGTFHGEDPVTKQQMAAVMLRMTEATDEAAPWDQVESVAVKSGLMSAGRTSGIHTEVARRADVFDMLDRALNSRNQNGERLEERLFPERFDFLKGKK